MKFSSASNRQSTKQTPYWLSNADFTQRLMDPSLEAPQNTGKKNTSTDRLSPAAKRFDVYRNNVVVSLMDALQAKYQSLYAILGNENFTKVSRIYVAENPPNSAMMQTYGDNFSNFIEKFQPLKNSPFLVDLAKVESAWIKAFHALDAAPLAPEALSEFDPEKLMELRFETHPSAHLIKSDFAIADLFNQRFADKAEDIDINIAQNILITRPEFEMQLFSIPDDLFVFLIELKERRTLGLAAQESFSNNPEFDLQGAISFLFQSGFSTRAALKFC